jgi:hypothetical protein
LTCCNVHAQTPRQGRTRIDPSARAFLAKVARNYRSLNAYGDDGVFTFTLKSGGKSVARSFPIPFQFVRPNQFAVDCGTLGVVSDGRTVTVINFFKQYRIKLKVSETLSTSGDPGLVKRSPVNVTLDGFRRSLTLGDEANEKSADMLLGQTGAQAVGILMALLVDEEAASRLTAECDRLTLMGEPGSAQTLSLGFRSAWEARLQVGPGDLLIRKMSLIPQDVGGDVALEWESGAVSTAPGAVGAALRKQSESFALRSKPFQLAPDMGYPPPAEITLPPVPIGTVSISDRVRSLISKLLAAL